MRGYNLVHANLLRALQWHIMAYRPVLVGYNVHPYTRTGTMFSTVQLDIRVYV